MSVEFSYAGPTNESILKDLANGNDFSDEDLKQNQAGRISDRQVVKLAAQALRPVFVSGGTLAFWLLFTWFIRNFVPALLQIFLFKYAVTGFWAITLPALGAFLIGLLNSSRLTILLIQDLSSGKSAVVEGRVTTSWEERPAQGTSRLWGMKESVYNYCIKDEYFEVSKDGYDVLHSKYDTYTPSAKLYYSPKSKMLLSLEPK